MLIPSRSLPAPAAARRAASRAAHRAARRGLTLVELLIVLVVLGIVGTALTRLLVQQGRSFSGQQAQREARIVSRNAVTILLAELRMAQGAGAVDSVGPNGSAVRVEVPYAFGVSCGNNGGSTIVRMAPIDSLTQARAIPRGYKWRNSATGLWTATAGTFSTTAATGAQENVCVAAQVRGDTIHGRVGLTLALQPAAVDAGGVALPAGTPIMLHQRITYRFAASAAYPQGFGLYRRVSGGAEEELLGPFDATARFRYYIAGNNTPTAATPTDLSTIRGLEMVLNGRSTRDAPGATGDVGPVVSKVTTGVLFKNTTSF